MKRVGAAGGAALATTIRSKRKRKRMRRRVRMTMGIPSVRMTRAMTTTLMVINSDGDPAKSSTSRRTLGRTRRLAMVRGLTRPLLRKKTTRDSP